MCYSYRPCGLGITEDEIQKLIRRREAVAVKTTPVETPQKMVRPERCIVDEVMVQTLSRERLFIEKDRCEYRRQRFMRSSHGPRGRKPIRARSIQLH